ncbi:nucleoside hydrolase [Candidatus Poriferisodalis sp.]|uniref:nucleoside hydrolase n=1 Tax=Candidatus Poriferisodalis sp. TaxID=3101277 RepID=UPI003B021131
MTTATAAAMTTRPAIILDCDPGHDDAVAMLLAARHCELLAVTTVSGNAPLHLTTQNALLVCQLAGLDMPVHAGADRPLLVSAAHAPRAHGRTGLDGPVRPDVHRTVASNDAVGCIIETVRARDGVWIVAVGPLTNVALAIRQAPDIVDRLAGISLMGGGAGPGNVTPTAEFNIWADPHAAQIVFAAGVPRLLMAGLHLTHQLCVGPEVIAALRAGGGTVAGFVAELFDFYVAGYRERAGLDAAPLHDPCAVLALTHPELLGFAARRVEVETTGVLTRGMTVVDERPGADGTPNCDVAYGIDADAAAELIVDAVCSYR